VTFKISDDNTEIVVEKRVENADYDKFVSALPPNECRYAVFDFEYDTEGEGKRNKILFYVWCVFEKDLCFVVFYCSWIGTL
jgi:cofilin